MSLKAQFTRTGRGKSMDVYVVLRRETEDENSLAQALKYLTDTIGGGVRRYCFDPDSHILQFYNSVNSAVSLHPRFATCVLQHPSTSTPRYKSIPDTGTTYANFFPRDNNISSSLLAVEEYVTSSSSQVCNDILASHYVDLANNSIIVWQVYHME
jgi:hypothetical protein